MGMLHIGGLTNFTAVFVAQTDLFNNKDWYIASFNGGADSAQIFHADGYIVLSDDLAEYATW